MSARRRAAAALALAAGATCVLAVRRGWRPAVPGAGEPRLRDLEPGEQAWLEEIGRQVDPAALRATVESMPGPRNRFAAREAMRAAEDALLRALTVPGWRVERQPYAFDDVPPGGFWHDARIPGYERLDGVNLVAVREGRESRDAVVVLAHYDTVEGTVGADDNTASLAALLALAEVLGRHEFRRTVVLASPDMEEIGFFGAYALASRLLAERRLLGVVCFDTMAYVSADPGSQRFPPGVDLLYPGQASRLRARGFRGEGTAVVYDGPAVPLARAFGECLATLAGAEAVMLFRDPRDLPVTGRLLRRAMPAVRDFSRSDHRAFWDAGVPAILVSDTANFRYPHYHEPTDTPEHLDYERLAAITVAAAGAIARTAGLLGPAAGGADGPVGAPARPAHPTIDQF